MRYLPFAMLIMAACSMPPGEAEERGGRGKQDAPGECTVETCGGKGVGDCYCDDKCDQYGDCCSNRVDICEAPAPAADGDIPEFGTNATIETLADASHGLNEPRDLAFNNAIPDQLFIVNQADDSVSIIRNFGTSNASISKHAGPGNTHFCANPAALAFGDSGIFATAHEEAEVTQISTPWDFMGPTLWLAELPLFDAGHASHIDMLHNSPNAVGIAHEAANRYYVFDGEHESITRYDFRMDHGPGGADHSDGVVRRYVEGEVSYVPGIPSHMEMEGGLLYIADTGHNRIAVMDPSVGTVGDPIQPNYDGVDQRHVIGGSIETLIDGSAVGMQAPSGLAIHEGRLFVSDAATGEIVAFKLDGTELGRIDTGTPGVMGITIGPDGDLYFINGDQGTLNHVAR